MSATNGSRPLLPTASGAQTRRALGGLLRPHPALAALTAVVLVVGTVASLAVPPLLGKIVDVVVDGRPAADVDVLAIALLIATAAHGALSGLGTLLVGRLGEQVLAGLRERVVERALVVPLEKIERHGTGDLVARVGGDVDAVSEAVREAIPELIMAVLTVGLTVVGLAVLDWRLALAGLVAAPVYALGARWYLSRSGPVYAAERIAQGERAQQLSSSIAGAGTVRAYGLGDRHARRVEASSQEAVELALRTGRLRAWFFTRINFAELVGLAAVLVAGFALVRGGIASVGEATAAALYFHRLFDPVGALLLLLDTAQEAAAALARLVGVAGLQPPAEPDSPVEPHDASVRLEGVRFAYAGGEEVLHGVELRIAPGERVALVGASGAGKTTIAKLIAGIHRPSEGHVRLGGVELDAIGSSRIGRTVALVTQEVHVFAGTLRDDLRLARPDAGDDVLASALSRVGALEWVRALPGGLATVVGEGGRRLSTTQAQQLALARLVLADAPVAVLDEATAEAGSTGARQLDAAAGAALHGRTGLVIAHRLTQAVAADRVVVLDAGAVVERGTHEQLVAAGGGYAELWSAWSTSR